MACLISKYKNIQTDIGIFSVTARLGLVGREATTIIRA